MAKLDMTPELEAAIADVRECASAFSDETAHFANGRFGCNLEIDVNETAYIFC